MSIAESPGLYREIRQSFGGKVGDDCLFSRYVIRPLSHPATVPFVLLGFSANAATWVGAATGLAAMFCFARAQEGLWEAGVILFFVYMVIDYVDGNIARYRDSASYYGKFLDGFVDAIVYSLFFISAGFGLGRQDDRSTYLMGLGVATALLVLYANLAVTRLSFFQRWVLSDRLTSADRVDLPAAKALSQLLNQKPAILSSRAYRGLISITLDCLYVGLLLTLLFDVRTLVFVIVSALFSINSILDVFIMVRSAKETVNYHRLSKNAG